MPTRSGTTSRRKKPSGCSKREKGLERGNRGTDRPPAGGESGIEDPTREGDRSLGLLLRPVGEDLLEGLPRLLLHPGIPVGEPLLEGIDGPEASRPPESNGGMEPDGLLLPLVEEPAHQALDGAVGPDLREGVGRDLPREDRLLRVLEALDECSHGTD